MIRRLILTASLLGLAACGQGGSAPAPDAPAASAPSPASAPAAPAANEAQIQAALAALPAPYNAADLENGRRAFARQAQVGEVAGDGNVVRPHPLQVVRKRGKKPLVLLAAPFQLPAQPAEQPFAEEIARSQQLRAGQVRIGAVGEHPPRGLARLVRIGRERPTGKGRDWSG